MRTDAENDKYIADEIDKATRQLNAWLFVAWEQYISTKLDIYDAVEEGESPPYKNQYLDVHVFRTTEI